jgi:hypothetical protein
MHAPARAAEAKTCPKKKPKETTPACSRAPNAPKETRAKQSSPRSNAQVSTPDTVLDAEQ